jgi:MFS family permease
LFVTLGAYAATVPRWLAEDGAGAATVGVVMAAMSVVAVLARPIAGRLSDVHGRRNAAVAGALVSAAGALLLLVPAGPWLAGGARGLVGIGEALVTTACIAWLVDVVPPHRRGRAMSWFGMSVWLGLSTGPQLGELTRDLGGFDLVWVLAAVAGLAAAALLAGVPDSPVRLSGGRIEFSIPRAVWTPGIAMGLAVLGEGVLVAFGIRHLEERGVPSGAGVGGAASVYTVLALGALVSRPLIATLPDRLGGRVCAMFGTGLIACGLGILALASSFEAAAAGAFPMGIGLALMYPSLTLVVAAGVAAHDRGVAVGAFTAFVDVGLAAGALAGGLVVEGLSTAAAFWAGAIAAALGGLLVAARAPRRDVEFRARGVIS